MSASHKKTAVVTGASSGFGRLTVQTLLAHDYRAFATLRDSTGRNAEAAAALREAGADVVDLDVTSDASVDRAAAEIADAVGAIDVLVNNAGNAYFGYTEAYTPAAVAKQFETNVFGPLRVDRAFLPAMRERKSGLVVYVSSVVGRMIVPFGGVYTASKWALEALAETKSYELRPFGIDVAIVEPGAYGTDIFSKLVEPDDAKRASGYAELESARQQLTNALGEMSLSADAQEVADAIVAIAEQPAGTRALRTVVGGGEYVETINRESAVQQRAILEAYGLQALLPKTAVPA